MKFKTTAKQIKNGYIHKFSCGYCEMYNLLRFHSPIAYTSGVYGWNFDVYEIDDVAISTGYRGMVGERLPKLAWYEKRAKEINESDLAYLEKETCINALLHDAIVNATGVLR